MTIGIGVLCSTYDSFDDIVGRPRPDALVIVADTMGSTPTDSTREMHKIYVDERLAIFASGAGHLNVCGELFSSITTGIGSIPRSEWTHGLIWKSISDSITGYRREKFERERLPDFVWSTQNRVSEIELREIVAAWQAYELGAEMLIGTFDAQGQALLYHLGRTESAHGFLHLVPIPGHYTIGSGAYNASLWLHRRDQHLGMSVHRSILHAVEASQFASSAPTVNSEIEMVIATKDCMAMRSTRDHSEDHTEFPITAILAEVQELAPKSTKEISFRRLDPRTLKDQP